MSLKIPYTRFSSAEKAYEVVKQNINKKEFERWNVEVDLDYNEPWKMITASGNGFRVTLEFTDYEVMADADMGLLLMPFKSKILNYLESRVKQVV